MFQAEYFAKSYWANPYWPVVVGSDYIPPTRIYFAAAGYYRPGFAAPTTFEPGFRAVDHYAPGFRAIEGDHDEGC